jgi:hypothetical protein
LGYNDNLTGTWPVNYVTQANKIEILDDVTVVAAAAAKRADVVVMLSATLDAEIVTYDKDTNEFVAKQSGIASSHSKTLLEDSFKGNVQVVEDDEYFTAVTQIKDATKKTLTWTPVTGGNTYTIDGDTAISSNAASLFDLKDHQGKVYYVTDGSQKIARYIEVKSYTKSVTATPVVWDANSTKVVVNANTNYNAVKNTGAAVNITGATMRNTETTLYYNEDDLVYKVVPDMANIEKSYIVKTVGTSSVKVVGEGSTNKTLNIKDGDTLIYTSEGFITPSELKVGDAIQQVSDGTTAATDLYVKVDTVTDTLTKATSTKYTIGGKSYVVAANVVQIDSDYDSNDTEIGDIYGNAVTYVLNKDNTIATIIVDQTSTGTTLYGVVMGGDSSNSGFGNSSSDAKNVDIFTSEGKTVTYEIDSDADITLGTLQAAVGHAVEYKLKSNGKIKSFAQIGSIATTGGSMDIDTNGKVDIKDSARLVDNADTAYTLTSNVIIFEVKEDDGDIEAAVVTRSSLLSDDNIEPSTLNEGGSNEVAAYVEYLKNTNGAIKVLAYTANTSSIKYGVVSSDVYSDGDYDDAITLLGDDTVYEIKGASVIAASAVKSGDFISYTVSGNTIDIKTRIANKGGLYGAGTNEVTGRNESGKTGYISFVVDGTDYFTDEDTQVYLMGSNGSYAEATVDDIVKNDYVYVIIEDGDEYVSVVLVDEYHNYND